MSIQDNQIEWMKEQYAEGIKKEMAAATLDQLKELIIVEENELYWKLSIHPSALFSKEEAAQVYTNYIKDEKVS